ncbi:MAG: hypothetical protein ABI867_27560 [Kofleriaceae bacterium]
MRTLLLAITLLSTPALADVHPVDATKKVAPAKAEDKFPVPKDAEGGDSQAGGGGKILLYKVPRGRDAVIAEVRELLKAGGWTISKDDSSPSGRAIRIEVKKNDKTYKVSFTGDDTRTALILTLP